MPRFRYLALDAEGRRHSGEFDASSRPLATEHLDQLGLLPIDLGEIQAHRQLGPGAWFAQLPWRTAGVVTQLTRELSMLLAAGLTLDRALAIIERDAPAGVLLEISQRLRHALAGGKGFAESLSLCGAAFPASYVSMVRVGEATGMLQTVLGRIAEAREKEAQIRAKIVSALLYPCLLLTTAVAAITGILVYVVPQFKEMIAGSGRPAPAPAAFVIAVSDGLITHGWLIIGLLALTIAGLISAVHQPVLRSTLAAIGLRIPLYGQLARHRATIIMCRTLGILLENGVDLALALKLTEETLGRTPAGAAVSRSREALRKGQSFVDVLDAARLFPRSVVSLLKVGEETGNLRDSVNWAARMSEERADAFIERSLKLVEPIVVLVASGIVASIMISIVTSVLSLNDLAN